MTESRDKLLEHIDDMERYHKDRLTKISTRVNERYHRGAIQAASDIKAAVMYYIKE